MRKLPIHQLNGCVTMSCNTKRMTRTGLSIQYQIVDLWLIKKSDLPDLLLHSPLDIIYDPEIDPSNVYVQIEFKILFVNR